MCYNEINLNKKGLLRYKPNFINNNYTKNNLISEFGISTWTALDS